MKVIDTSFDACSAALVVDFLETLRSERQEMKCCKLTAHKLTSSQAHSSLSISTIFHSAAVDSVSKLRFDLINLLLLLILVQLLGCGNSLANHDRVVRSNASSGELNDAKFELELGIVDQARGGYFCLPLSRFDLSKSDKIDRVDCSCPCVSAKAVDYVGIDGTNHAALIIEVVPGNDLAGNDLAGNDLGIQLSHFESETIRRVKNSTANLAVEIRVVFVSGIERRLRASFLHTYIGSRTEE